MDASLNFYVLASFLHHINLNNSVSFSAIGSPSVYRSRQELRLRLVLCQMLNRFPCFPDGWKFIMQNIALYLWQTVDSIAIDS